MTRGEPNVQIPLAVVGADYRTAPAAFRERLLTSAEDRKALFGAIQQVDAAAGFAVLETCNRVEWIVSTGVPCWMAQLLTAQMVQRFQRLTPPDDPVPQPYIHVDIDAARHILRVAAGMESMATGEAQIAGQIQRALKTAISEHTASIVTNGLSSAAGRIAKAATRAGFRSNYYKGIHSLVLETVRSRSPGPLHNTAIAVIGMGDIGRKTAAILQENTPSRILRFNRTLPPDGSHGYLPLKTLPDHLHEIGILVAATGARSPILTANTLPVQNRREQLLLIDIGIPRQVDPRTAALPQILYLSVDDLNTGSGPDPAALAALNHDIDQETARFRRFCLARDMVGLLDTIHQKRTEYLNRVIPGLLENELAGIRSSDRKRIESAMQQVIRDYANDVFNSIHTALDDYRSA